MRPSELTTERSDVMYSSGRLRIDLAAERLGWTVIL
jgi:hypothetical protein